MTTTYARGSSKSRYTWESGAEYLARCSATFCKKRSVHDSSFTTSMRASGTYTTAHINSKNCTVPHARCSIARHGLHEGYSAAVVVEGCRPAHTHPVGKFQKKRSGLEKWLVPDLPVW